MQFERAFDHHHTAGYRFMQNWAQWQNEVLILLQSECVEALRHISIDDVDWVAWRCFYDQGKTPRASIDRALQRDLKMRLSCRTHRRLVPKGAILRKITKFHDRARTGGEAKLYE